MYRQSAESRVWSQQLQAEAQSCDKDGSQAEACDKDGSQRHAAAANSINAPQKFTAQQNNSSKQEMTRSVS